MVDPATYWAWSQVKLSPEQKLVLVCLAYCRAGQGARFRAPVEVLSARCGLCQGAVTLALVALDHCGLIRRVALGAEGATYVLGCDLEPGAGDDGGADEH